MSDLRVSLGADSRTILVTWARPALVGRILEGYRVTSQIVGVGDCDSEFDAPSRSVVVDEATTTRLIDDVTPWRRYRITVSSLYSDDHANSSAEISSRETGQVICIILFSISVFRYFFVLISYRSLLGGCSSVSNRLKCRSNVRRLNVTAVDICMRY